MPRLLIYLLLSIVLTGAGCTIFKSEMENDLDAAIALWEAEGFANYSMRLEISGWIGLFYADEEGQEYGIKSGSGLLCVTPAWKMEHLLFSKEFRNMRK